MLQYLIILALTIDMIQSKDPFVMTECDSGQFTCKDGQVVIKNPLNNCAFNACLDGTIPNENPPNAVAGINTSLPPNKDIDNATASNEKVVGAAENKASTSMLPPSKDINGATASKGTATAVIGGMTQDEATTLETNVTSNATSTTPAPSDATPIPAPKGKGTETLPSPAPTPTASTKADTPVVKNNTTSAPETETLPSPAPTPAASTNTTIAPETGTASDDGWVKIEDLSSAKLIDVVGVAFHSWQSPDVCSSFNFTIGSGASKVDEAAKTKVYDLGVDVECLKTAELFDGHFHIHVFQHRDTGDMMLHACALVDHGNANNWLAMIGDSPVCETSDMRLSLQHEAVAESVQKSSGPLGNFLNDLDRQTSVVAGVAGVALLLLIVVIAVAVRRQTHSDRSRSILTGDVETAVAEDERDDGSPRDDKVFDNESEGGSDGEEVEIETISKSDLTDDAKSIEDDEEGSFV